MFFVPLSSISIGMQYCQCICMYISDVFPGRLNSRFMKKEVGKDNLRKPTITASPNVYSVSCIYLSELN